MNATHTALLKQAPLALMLSLFISLPLGAKAADHALSFATQAQIVSTTGMVTSAAFTYEAWFKITTFAGENQVVAQYANHPGRLIVGAKNTKAWFFIGGTSLDGVATLPSNTWTHIAVTRSNSTAKIYINGALDKSSTSFNTNNLPLTGITIGVGLFGGYAAIVAVFLGIAGFSPRRTAPAGPAQPASTPTTPTAEPGDAPVRPPGETA